MLRSMTRYQLLFSKAVLLILFICLFILLEAFSVLALNRPVNFTA